MKTVLGSVALWVERIVVLLAAAVCFVIVGAFVAWLLAVDWQALVG
jgi:hypothetical protein